MKKPYVAVHQVQHVEYIAHAVGIYKNVHFQSMLFKDDHREPRIVFDSQQSAEYPQYAHACM